MTVSDITRAKYDRSIRCESVANIWAYVCKRKDNRVALVIAYHHESKTLAPPMLHRECKELAKADSDCQCQFLGSLCNAEPWGFMNWEKFKDTHGGKFEPMPAFWDLMIEAIELRRVPEEPTHETL